jgi:hypothetical protein
MNTEKAAFLKTSFLPLLKRIPAGTQPLWGKKTLQQMIEHFTDAVRIAAGTFSALPLVTPAEHLPKMQAFIQSDKPFRENTRNPLLPEKPVPVRAPFIQAALDELQAALDSFFDTFETIENDTTHNPLFGGLDFDLNVRLLYKHALHHLRQFGVDAAMAGTMA